MKRIAIISDTHGCADDKLMSRLVGFDEIWHAGDIGGVDVLDELSALAPLRAVYGNIDDATVRRETAKFLNFECEGLKVLMTHIGGYPGRYDAEARRRIVDLKPDLFVCGHSHILKVMYDERLGVMTMNPGAAGIKGFHNVRTILRLTVSDGKMTDLEVVEFG